MATVVFLHAHPDDEAIFTGGTIAMLSDVGHRVVVVFATDGGLGLRATPGQALQAIRAAESDAAAELLGIDRLVFLGYGDSGLHLADAPEGSFATQPVAPMARALEAVLRDERADAIVGYDAGGIYAHPDHLQVHRVARAAADGAGTPTRYEATVDREHLHFVETHVVIEASGAIPGLLGADPSLALSATSIGSPTVEIDLEIDVHPVIERKRAALAAHASQISGDSSALALAPTSFSEVYGREWYTRAGPIGPLDTLSAVR